jgi:hypothetical protein
MEQQPTAEYQKSSELEAALQRVNAAILGREIWSPKPPERPVLIIVGNPRSGTTLLLQWLASTGAFGYPSNLIARFYANPAFGAEVQKILVHHDKEGQFGLQSPDLPFSSDLGRSKGTLAPSEFWYFWRRYFPFVDHEQLTPGELAQVDTQGILNDLGALEQALGKPLAMKGMMLNWHIPFLAAMSPMFVFLSVKRDLFSIAQSILLARQRYCGSRQGWWSFRPPGYRDWLTLDPCAQVAAQAVATQQAIDAGLRAVPPTRQIDVPYEEFCRAPNATYAMLRDCLSGLGESLGPYRSGPDCFEPRAGETVSPEDAAAIRDALQEFSSQPPPPGPR